MLLRPQGEYHTPYPLELTEAIDQLSAAIQNNETELDSYIDSVLHAVWQREWTITPENKFPDPTERFLMLKTLHYDGTFAPAENVTPLLAKFKYIIRVYMLRCMTCDEASRQTCEELERWFHEKVNSTFNTICDLQHRASAIAYNAQKLPNFFWIDTERYTVLEYKGNLIKLAALQDMFAKLEQDMKSTWEQDIMLDSKLHIKYDHIFDDVSNKTPGHSFLSDQRNPFRKYRTTLAAHILNNSALRSQFTYVEGNKIRWRRTALLQWLSKYSTLSELHLLTLEMLSGGPSRGTELTAMAFANTLGRETRNLIGIGGHVVMMRTYSKTTAITGQDRLIPHSLNAFESDLLVQDLALARPFAEFVVSQCFPTDDKRRTLYQSHIFINNSKLFNTTDLSNIMARYTLEFLQERITVRDWRHISIAFRRKLCPGQIALLEDNTAEDHIAAEQTGHTARTEQLKYVISAEALVGPSEDILPLFLQASNNWQQVMRMVPGMYKPTTYLVSVLNNHSQED